MDIEKETSNIKKMIEEEKTFYVYFGDKKWYYSEGEEPFHRIDDEDENKEILDQKVAEINANGKGRAIGVVCDVRDYSQICNVRDITVQEFGSIDVVVNFAGGYARRMLKVDSALEYATKVLHMDTEMLFLR